MSAVPPEGLPPVPNRSAFSPRALAAIVVGVTLVAGILVGIGLDRAFFVRPMRGRPFGGGPPFGMPGHVSNGKLRQQMRDRFARDLNLTPDQQARIDTIVKHRLAAFDSIEHENWPRVRALISGTRAQIDSVLTPEQRERYRSLGRRRGHRFGFDSAPSPP